MVKRKDGRRAKAAAYAHMSGEPIDTIILRQATSMAQQQHGRWSSSKPTMPITLALCGHGAAPCAGHLGLRGGAACPGLGVEGRGRGQKGQAP